MMIKGTEKAPAIRFRGFTDDWEQRKLGEFGKATGGTSIESEFVEKGNYKVISIGSYSETSKYNDQGLRTNKTPKTESKILNKDDLTMILNDKTAAGNIIGRVLLIDADNSYVYNQRTERIEVYKEDFEPSFLYQLLNAENIRSKIIKASQGNTQIYVNWSSISELEYLIPKVKSEQKKIATILNNLDNLITLHQRKLELMKKLKAFFLKNMFPEQGETVPRIRFKGFTGDWEQRKLGDIAEIIGGGTPDTNNKDYWNGDINWYAPAEIGDQIYVNSSERKITKEGYNNSSAKILPVGTVLFTSRAGIGKTAILTREGCTNQGFQSIVPHKNQLDSYFIFSRTKELQNYGEKMGAGSTFVEVSGKQMADMQLMMPSTLKEQQQIGLCLRQIDNLITLHQRKIDQLQTVKKFMLQNLFI